VVSQRQKPIVHVNPVLHMSFAQHGLPMAPHAAQVPPMVPNISHTSPMPVHVLPVQQGSPAATPHATQAPMTLHATPVPVHMRPAQHA
jgi:hypothetical protein